MFSRPSNSIKGLSIFISDLRDCATPEDEARRVNQEFGKILTKFALPTLSGYDFKKYVYKLVYAYIMGYDGEVGRMQSMNLLASAKISEKTAGYLGLNILASSDPEILRLSLPAVKTDLAASSDLVVGLALNFVANTANGDFIRSILPEIVRLLDASSPTSLYMRRKVIMCLLRLVRSGYKMETEQWLENLGSFLREADIGIVNAAAAVTLQVVKGLSTATEFAEWQDLLDATMKALHTVSETGVSLAPYYGVGHPWVHVKLLTIAGKFPVSIYGAEKVVEANELIAMLFAVNSPMTPQAELMNPTKTVRAELDRLNKLTGQHCILFGASEWGLTLEKSLTSENRKLVGQFLANCISDRGPNVRYLALELLGRLANTTHEIADPAQSAFERKLFERCRSAVVSEIVTGVDSSSRRAALAVLVATCDKTNWETVVEELLTVLGTLPKETVRCSLKSGKSTMSSDSLALLKEELSLQISLIAERYAPDPSWNVDILFRSLKFAPAFVPESVVRRVLGLIATSAASSSGVVAGQSQAAERAYEALGGKMAKFPSVPQNVLVLSMFVLGEYGWRLVESKRVSALRLVEVIAGQLPTMTRKGVGLFGLAKIGQRFAHLAGVREDAIAAIECYTDAIDLDTAQRANELIALFKRPDLFAKLFASSPTASAVTAAGAAGGDDDDEDESSSSEEEVDPKTLWRFLCVKPEGVLFSSEDVEVTVRQTGEKYGRLVMRIAARKALTGVSVKLMIPEGLAVVEDRKLENERVEKQSYLEQVLTVTLKTPFLNPPKYVLKYTVGGGRETTLPLSLPVILTKFARPTAAMTAETFAAKWRSLPEMATIAAAQTAMDPSKFPGYLVHGFGFALVGSGGSAAVLEGGAMIGDLGEVLIQVEKTRISVKSKTSELAARYVANIVASYFVASGKWKGLC
jgi:AP-2 complex subunit alpha